MAKPPSVPPAAFEPADASKTPSFPPDEVIPLETLRLGLRSDTLRATTKDNIDGAGI